MKCHAFGSTDIMHLNFLGPNKVFPMMLLPFLGVGIKGWSHH